MTNLNPNQQKALQTISNVIKQWTEGENPPTCSCYNEKVLEITSAFAEIDALRTTEMRLYLMELLDVIRKIK